MYVERHTVALTTAEGGAAEGFTPVVNGRVISIAYAKHATNPMADTVDLVVSGEESGTPILTRANLTASGTFAPRQPVHAVADGAALLYAAGGAPVTDHVFIAGERIKIAVANGGDAKPGTFTVIVG
jgi:hypothetical protein